jgi:predicted nucleic acid-binding protein
VRLYLDSSVIVAIVTRDFFTDRAYHYLNIETPNMIVSDFAAAEFASAVARRVRMRELTPDQGRRAFVTFDGLAPRAIERIETSPADMKGAEAFLRRLDLPLRAPDALNIAIAQRIDATLMTFDDKMAVAVRALGVAVAAA